MSGPIVRKYGFPNFEKIFGERELQHGVDDVEPSAQPAEPSAPAKAKTEKGAASKKKTSKTKK